MSDNNSMDLNEFCEKNNISEGIWGIENISKDINSIHKEKGIKIKIIPDSEMPESTNENDVELIHPSPLERFANHCIWN